MTQEATVDIREVLKARQTVARNLKPTQLIRYETLSRLIGADIYVKHENHHPSSSQKIRGAVNLVSELRRNGVTELVTVASGNHSVAIACAANMFSMRVRVVAGQGSKPLLLQRLKDMGAEVSVSGNGFAEALRLAQGVEARTGHYFVHPAEESQFISGCGTACLEVLEELPDVDVMIGSLGFGTCLSSTIAVTSAISPKVRVIGVQAEQAPAAYLSWQRAGIARQESETFASELAVNTAYSLPFSIYYRKLADFLLLTEEQLHESVALAAYHCRQLVDAAGAAPILAAYHLKEKLAGKTVVLYMSSSFASPDELEQAYALPAFQTGMPTDDF
ncbi:threonine dehydratase [Hahella sp. CCB-MM4]|uniref:threonine ammonia-lyase n=1 Tax=Hahella sp. (strain CCB-MM4) TaxID=1926491 RepID=UPI000B9B3FC2|nr:pyridoxal-phosphate dependent enzyme [Hahella sp. CCB-MM4]OZG73873.1 threonine dehydratase [Hahella sp. CCB-MM4]